MRVCEQSMTQAFLYSSRIFPIISHSEGLHKTNRAKALKRGSKVKDSWAVSSFFSLQRSLFICFNLNFSQCDQILCELWSQRVKTHLQYQCFRLNENSTFNEDSSVKLQALIWNLINLVNPQCDQIHDTLIGTLISSVCSFSASGLKWK